MAGAFLWGSGGRRMTPEDITRERALAARRLQGDYSPVQHWTQGLGRIADGLIGGLESRRADRASEANAADSQRVLEALMNPGAAQMGTVAQPATAPMQDITSALGNPDTSWATASPVAAQPGAMTAPAGGPPSAAGAPSINPAIIQALTSPYVSDEVRQLATLQYRQQLEAANRRPNEPPEIVQLMQLAGVDPASPQGRAMLAQAVQGRVDPIVAMTLPDGRGYTGPRSGIPGGAATPAPPTDPSYWTPVEQGGPTREGSGGFPW